MCRSIRSDFHDWTDYNGFTFSGIFSRVTEWNGVAFFFSDFEIEENHFDRK